MKELRSYFLGTGKSHDAYRDVARDASAGNTVVLVVPNHRVGLEAEEGVAVALRALGRADVPVVHVWSRLQDARTSHGEIIPACVLSRKLRVIAEGVGGFQVGRVCSKCEHREKCAARAFADENGRRVRNADAKVIIVTEAGFDSLPPLVLASCKPYADDIAESIKIVDVDSETFALIGSEPVQDNKSKGLWFVRDESAAAARAIVRAWKRGGTDYGTIRMTPRSKRSAVKEGARQFDDTEVTEGDDLSVDVPVVEWLAGDALDVVSAADAPLKPKHLRVARAVREILLLAKSGWAPKAKIHELKNAYYVSPVYQTLAAQDGVLLDGTPNRGLMRLAGITFASETTRPYDATANVMRTWYPCGNAYGEARTRRPHANRKALMHRVWSEKTSRFEEHQEMPAGVIGGDWPRVLTAMRRAATAAARAGCPDAWVHVGDLAIKNVILETLHDDSARVTMDVIEQRNIAELAALEVDQLIALQECRRLVGGDELKLAHFGNVRSRNDWSSVMALSVLGTPYLAATKMLAALGVERDVDPDHYDLLRDEYAANELAQVVERSRSTRRVGRADDAGVLLDVGPSEPLWLYVESDVCPAGPWAETAQAEVTHGWSVVRSECRHEYLEQTHCRLAAVAESILAERGEGYTVELAADRALTAGALRKYRVAGAFPVHHEGALLELAPDAEWRPAVLESLPPQDVLQNALQRVVDDLGRQRVAQALGVSPQQISRLRLRQNIGEAMGRAILRLREGAKTASQTPQNGTFNNNIE